LLQEKWAKLFILHRTKSEFEEEEKCVAVDVEEGLELLAEGEEEEEEEEGALLRFLSQPIGCLPLAFFQKPHPLAYGTHNMGGEEPHLTLTSPTVDPELWSPDLHGL